MDLFSLVATLGLDTSAFDSTLSKVGKGATKLLTKALGMAADAAVDFAKDVITTGMDVDKTFSSVQAVLGKYEGTPENMARLMEYAQEVAADSIFTLEETGDAYYYMGMAGWKTEQMIAGLPGVIALAAASGEDLAMTSDIVTDTLTAFGLGAGQAAHFADVLAVTATNTNTDVARMGQTFKYLAPVAGALGYSIEDIATSVGLVANSGIKGSMAGTSLRNIFTRIATNAGATKEKLGALDGITEELGVSFYDASGKARPWIDVLTESREAWKKLDPSKADEIASAFGDIAVEGQDASEIMQDFTNDLDVWITEWNGLTTDAERESFVKKYEKQFQALGISMRDSKGKLREFNDVAGEARIKLGGLNDEEKLYYAQQIGNLRGMTSWLALMNASEKDFKQVTHSIEEAAGAAQDMADVKLDNLWGDVQMFQSHLDILKYAIFDDVKGPLRDVVQYATGAIERITEKINKDGLLGGLQQLAVEIEGMSYYLEPVMRSLGKALAPMVETLFQELLPSVIEAAGTLSASFVGGLGRGITDNSGVLGKIIGGSLTAVGDVGELVSGFFKLLSPSIPPLELNEVEITPELLQNAIDEAEKNGKVSITINGLEAPVSAWKSTLEEMQGDLEESVSSGMDAGVSKGSNAFTEWFGKKVTGVAQTSSNLLGTVFSGAVADGISAGTKEADGTVRQFTLKSGKTIQSTFSSAVEEGTKDGGEWTYVGVKQGIEKRKFAMRKSVSDVISAGVSEGADEGITDMATQLGNADIEVPVMPEITAEEINAAFRQAMLAGSDKVTIRGVDIDLNDAMEHYDDMADYIQEVVSSKMNSGISDGAASGSKNAAKTVRSTLSGTATSVGNTFAKRIGSAGNSGGSTLVTNVNTKLSNKGNKLTNTLATNLGNAGSSAGNTIVSAIQSALSFATFAINVVGSLLGFGGDGVHFAKAQNAGRILQGATVFGVNANGQPLIGGENGPEAIIGTNSLKQMVFDAAGQAVAGTMGEVTINVYQQPGEDQAALAERIERLIARKELRRRSSLR